MAVNSPQPSHKAHRESVLSRVLEWNRRVLPPADRVGQAEEKTGGSVQSGAVQGNAENQFVFQLSKSLNHSGKATTFDVNLLEIEGTGVLRIPRQWARKRKIKKGDRVVVRSSHAQITLPVEPVAGLSDREVHFPLHFADGPVMAIFGNGAAWHDRSGVPLGQSVSVTLENVTV